jgi:hypothetical protein
MNINTKQVANRRDLRFNDLADVLTEAERLSAGPVRSLGNWSAGQVFKHLALSMNNSIDGSSFKAPWWIRLGARMMLGRMLKGKMPAGFKLPESARAEIVADDSITTDEGLHALREAIERQATQTHREPHGAFGRLSREQWEQLHLRHAEMHLSFLESEK